MIVRRVNLEVEFVSEDNTFSEFSKFGLSKQLTDKIFYDERVMKELHTREAMANHNFLKHQASV